VAAAARASIDRVADLLLQPPQHALVLGAADGVDPAVAQFADQEGVVEQGAGHVKCAVADGRWLFLSSANLTENAFT
jgi:hypothetical protein